MEDEAAHMKLWHCTCPTSQECTCSAQEPEMMLDTLIDKHVPDQKVQEDTLGAKRREFLEMPHSQQQAARSEFQMRECEILLETLRFIFKVAIASAAARPRDIDCRILHNENPLYMLSIYQQMPLFHDPDFIRFAGLVDRAEREETELAKLGPPRMRQMAAASAAAVVTAQAPRFDHVDAQIAQLPATTAAIMQPQQQPQKEAALYELAMECKQLFDTFCQFSRDHGAVDESWSREMIKRHADDCPGDLPELPGQGSERTRYLNMYDRYLWLRGQGFDEHGRVPRASATCAQCAVEGIHTLVCPHAQRSESPDLFDAPEPKRLRTDTDTSHTALMPPATSAQPSAPAPHAVLMPSAASTLPFASAPSSATAPLPVPSASTVAPVEVQELPSSSLKAAAPDVSNTTERKGFTF